MKKNKDILVGLLECILKVKIKEIEYLNLERNSGNVHVMRKHLDLNLETDIGRLEIEVNASHAKYVKARNTAYLCDIYSHYVEKGDKYDEETLIIQINFSYGLPDDGKYVRKYTISDETGQQFVKNFIIYDINMSKYEKMWYNSDIDEIQRNKYFVMLFLGKKELVKLTEILKKDKVVKEYMDELKRLNEDPKFREYMSIEEDNRKIENSIKDEYFKMGSINKAMEMAKSMLKDNISKETISKYTNLSIEEIEKLMN